MDDRQLIRRYFWITAGVSTILLAVTTLYPFTMDHGLYQAMAVQLLRYHRLPYVGSWDMNFPGIVFIHAFAILLFGNSEVGLRSLDVIMHVALVLLFYKIMVRRLSPPTAFIACFFVCATYLGATVWNSAQRDGFASFFIITAIFLLYKIKDRTKPDQPRLLEKSLPLLMGLMVGAAITIRPTFGLFAIIIGVALWKISRRESRQRLSIYFAGITLLAVAILIPYVLKPGALHEFYLATIRFNLDIYGSSKYRLPLSGMLMDHTEIMVDIGLVAYVLILLARKQSWFSRWKTEPFEIQPDRFDTYLFIACYVASRIHILVMGKFFRQHYEFLIILTSLLFVLVLTQVSLTIKTHQMRHIVLSLILVVVLIKVYPWKTAYWFFEGLSKPGSVLTYVHSTFSRTYEIPNNRDSSLYNYIRSRTTLQDRIELCGEDAELYWKSELQPATRFTLIFPIAMQKPNGGYTDYQLQWRREFVDSIRTVQPKFIILAEEQKTILNFLSEPPSNLVREVSGFNSLLEEQYAFDSKVSTYEIYQRRNDTRVSGANAYPTLIH